MIDNIKLGTQEAAKEALQPKPVKVTDISTAKYDKAEKEILVLTCKHPDNDNPIKISKIKHEKKNKLEVEGLWLSLDDEKNVLKNSALGKLLQYYKCNSLHDLIGKELLTSHNDQKYLVIKAYD